MKTIKLLLVFSVFFLCASSSYGQESIVGKYTVCFDPEDCDPVGGLEIMAIIDKEKIEMVSVDNGKMKTGAAPSIYEWDGDILVIWEKDKPEIKSRMKVERKDGMMIFIDENNPNANMYFIKKK